MNAYVVTNQNVVNSRFLYEGGSRRDGVPVKEKVYFSSPAKNGKFSEGDVFVVCDDMRKEGKRYSCLGAVDDGENVNVSGIEE